MIKLNTEKGLVEIASIEDIFSRPAFIDNLDPKSNKLKSIIGKYTLEIKIKCGLSNCHTKHNNGYIVTTPEGRETNIGKDCGFKHFGVTFKELSKRLERDITEKENRETLHSFKNSLVQFQNKLQNIKDFNHGASWYLKNTKILLNKTIMPNIIVDQLNSMIKKRTSTLSIEVATTEHEKELMRASGNKVEKFKTQVLGNISGLNALYTENNLRKVITVDIEEQLQIFDNLDIESLSYTELNNLTKWVNSSHILLKTAQNAIDAADKLLEYDNLLVLRQLLDSASDKKNFDLLMNNYK